MRSSLWKERRFVHHLLTCTTSLQQVSRRRLPLPCAAAQQQDIGLGYLLEQLRFVHVSMFAHLVASARYAAAESGG